MSKLEFFRPIQKQLNAIQDCRRLYGKKTEININSNSIHQDSTYQVVYAKGIEGTCKTMNYDINDWLAAYLKRWVDNGFDILAISIINNDTY